MPNDSRLIYVHGPRDESGLDHYYLYCRSCHMVSDFVPSGCLGLLTLRPFTCEGVMDPREVYADCHRLGTPEVFGIFAPKIQEAMRADGVIPR